MAASFADPPVTELVRIDVVAQGARVRLAVTGEIDSSTAPELAQRIDGVLDGDLDGELDQLTIDLCAVSFLDSAGLSALATAYRRTKERQVGLRVLASSRAVVRPLEITGLWQLLGAEQVDAVEGDQSVA